MDTGRIRADDGSTLTIVSDQVTELGGVEQAIEALIGRFPAARLVAPRFDPTPGTEAHFDVRLRALAQPAGEGSVWRGELSLVGSGGRRRHFYGPLYARRIGHAPLDTESVLSVGTAAWSLAAAAPPGAPHVAWMGGPPRALYGHSAEYLREYPLVARPLLRGALPALRAHHRALLRRPDRLLANSECSARGLEEIAGRPVGVVHPPVRTGLFTPAPRERRHFVAVSRLRAHKRVDLLVEAFRYSPHRLVVAGDGPWLGRLRAAATPNVTFAGHLGAEELLEVYRSSHALVSASVEEFGICIAEAQAVGIPAIAPRSGGSGEIVVDGETGILLDDLRPRSIAAAVDAVASFRYSPAACRAAAERFSEERFVAALERELRPAAAERPPAAPAREPALA